ncbi:META domain-containing protein [Flavobacterium eburneipallidum]|uniref:META domain-containing protein n=1 Tax=Flavobacterium eburneipallidum TaxID=3003263 RepID=UPI0022AC6E24|nr:META domain-containing protein [Flavobacterium eburneipallidum]
MKSIIFSLAIFCITLLSCNTTKSIATTDNGLQGTWQLNYITGPRIAFNGLYPEKKPTINFDLKENKISGNNSCNQYFGALLLDANKINFKDAKIGSTMMACQGLGEATYMKTLEKVDSYSISKDGKILSFISGNIEMMRFEKVISK